MKKILLLVFVIVALGGGVFLFMHRSVKAPVVPVLKPEKTAPVPIREPSVTVPQTIVTKGFVIGVVSVSKSVNGEYLSLKITNDSDAALALHPDVQFKLVGLKDQTTRQPIPEQTTKGFATNLQPNADVTGTILFDVIPEQESELRFYPDPTQPTYIVVPLIPLPEDQR